MKPRCSPRPLRGCRGPHSRTDGPFAHLLASLRSLMWASVLYEVSVFLDLGILELLSDFKVAFLHGLIHIAFGCFHIYNELLVFLFHIGTCGLRYVLCEHVR